MDSVLSIAAMPAVALAGVSITIRELVSRPSSATARGQARWVTTSDWLLSPAAGRPIGAVNPLPPFEDKR